MAAYLSAAPPSRRRVEGVDTAAIRPDAVEPGVNHGAKSAKTASPSDRQTAAGTSYGPAQVAEDTPVVAADRQ